MQLTCRVFEEKLPSACGHGFVGDGNLGLSFRLLLRLGGQFSKKIFQEPIKFPTTEILNQKLAEN